MAFSIGVGVREVESETLHRASSELAGLIFRYKNYPVEKAVQLAFNGIVSKYLTGVEDRELLFKELKVDNFFPASLEFLIKIYSIAAQANAMDSIQFVSEVHSNWKDYSPIAPIAHILYLFTGQRLELGESIRFLTGNVVTDPNYRKYLLQKNYQNLQFYLDAYAVSSALNADEITNDAQEFIQKIQMGCKQINSEIFQYFAEVFKYLSESPSMEVAEVKLNEFAFKKLKEWKQNDTQFADILYGIFGTPESARLELKYSGIATEADSIAAAIAKLKNLLDLDIDYEADTKDSTVVSPSLNSALEEISAQRKKKVILETPLQKKIFCQGLNNSERDLIFTGIYGQTFREFIKARVTNTLVDINNLDTMSLEKLYLQITGEESNVTLMKYLDKLQPEVQDSKVIGRQSASKFEQIKQILTNKRTNVDFNNQLRLKAVFNGLEDKETQEISQILFSVPSSSRAEIFQEFLKVLDNKAKFDELGQDINQIDQLGEATKKIREFVTASLKYGLSPALDCYDLAITAINWTKESVNDVYIALGADDSFHQNLGKVAIYSLCAENSAVFPMMRENSHLLIAYITSLLIKDLNFSSVLSSLKERSYLISTYTGFDQYSLGLKCNLWSIANEIWLRHLNRERKKKVTAKEVIKKLTPEEKARRAYQTFESALVKYTYSLKSKQGIQLLGITHEDDVLRSLKFIQTNDPVKLYETTFQIGDENLNLGSLKLIDALVSIISSNQGRVRENLLKVNEKLDNNQLEDISAEIVNLFNISLIQDTKTIIDSSYLSQVQKFCSKFSKEFVPSTVVTLEARTKFLNLIIHEMGKEFIQLQTGYGYDPIIMKNIEIFKEVFRTIFDEDTISHIRNLVDIDETLNPSEYKKLLENFARQLWVKGIKRNSFTILLNHLLVERTRGSAEIGSEYWKRYVDRCRYILRRIDQTTRIVKF